MTNREEKTVGYVALHLSQTMFCENGACIVASDQSALNKLLKASSLSPKEFQKRKTPFSAIVQGLTMGGSYAFDRDSFKLF